MHTHTHIHTHTHTHIYIVYVCVFMCVCVLYTLHYKLFTELQKKENTNKYHLLMRKDKSSKTHICEHVFKISDYKILLGIKIDSKPYF